MQALHGGALGVPDLDLEPVAAGALVTAASKAASAAAAGLDAGPSGPSSPSEEDPSPAAAALWLIMSTLLSSGYWS